MTDEDIFDSLFNDSELGREMADTLREAHENGEFSMKVDDRDVDTDTDQPGEPMPMTDPDDTPAPIARQVYDIRAKWCKTAHDQVLFCDDADDHAKLTLHDLVPSEVVGDRKNMRITVEVFPDND